MSPVGIVVAGAGQAGFQLAASLREGGFRDPITLVGDEAALPYQRPPLSKAYLAGKTDQEGLFLRPPASSPSTPSRTGRGSAPWRSTGRHVSWSCRTAGT